MLISIPIYLLIALLIRPTLREKINQRFNTGAASQQFLVESVFGIQTLKAAAVEPILRNEWEDRLAAYVKTSFQAVMLSNFGQNAIQYVNKATTAAVLFFGAKAVIDGDLTVGGLVAFNMIMNQVAAPILRLSQLWQDFQQVQISVERLGDILNSPPESQRLGAARTCRRRAARSSSADLTFRYQADGAGVLRDINLDIPAGQVLGIVGPSGSGKSTLTKLMQRLYRPERGQILIDGVDIGQVDTAWLRRQIGVVLQENMLFNRSIHDNIALANPGMPRGQVIAVARLAGADEFIAKLPLGYDTSDRGARRQSLRRPAPAHRHCARARHPAAHPDLRRGDQRARLRERADHPEQHARDRARPHRDHHRPSPGGGAPLRSHHRHREWIDRGGGHARVAVGAPRQRLRQAVAHSGARKQRLKRR